MTSENYFACYKFSLTLHRIS